VKTKKTKNNRFLTLINNFITLSYFKVSNKRKVLFYSLLILMSTLFIIKYFYAKNLVQVPIVKTLIELLLFYMITLSILSFLKILIISIYRKLYKINIDNRDDLITGVESIYWIILIITLFIGTLQFIDIDFTTFFTSFALISVAFSWIFKEYIANIIDGILIMFSDDFKIGDYIKVGDYVGIIREITFLNTEIRTDEGDIVFIPNTLIIQREVTNFSKVKYKRIIHDFEIDKNLFTKVRKIEKLIIKNLIKEFGDVFESEKFFLKIVKIKGDSAVLAAEMPVTKYTFSIEEQMEKNVSLTVMEYIDSQEDTD
jgi:small-conductance mechanosensitive channel